MLVHHLLDSTSLFNIFICNLRLDLLDSIECKSNRGLNGATRTEAVVEAQAGHQ